MGSRKALSILAVSLAALASLPVLAVIARGIAPGAADTWSHLAGTVMSYYVGNTLALVVMVAIGAGVGGTATAWLVAHRRFPGAALFDWALLLPLAMPAYVMAYAYTDFLQYAGPLQSGLRTAFGWSRDDYWFPEIRSLGGAAVMFIFTLYPYVYLLARNAFLERPPSLLEVAQTLGHTRAQVFWRIELPLARPAIAGGVALALMETLADFGTVGYFAINTFTTGIYHAWFSLGDRAAAAQLASVLLGFVVLAITLERVSRRSVRVAPGARERHSPPSRPALTGARAWIATLACTVPLVIGFVVPIFLVVRLLLSGVDVLEASHFAFWAWNSLRVATMAAVLVVAAAILIAYAARLAPGTATRWTSQILMLGYAVPGTVLAVGVLLPIGALDQAFAEWMRGLTGKSPGLLLTGTVFALLYAYLVRYFAVAWNGIEPGFARITPAMDYAARSLGAGTAEMLRRVHGPLLARSAAATFLLVFVDVMKELPATLVLRPFNFNTLATQTYQFARDERLTEAALPSLAMVLVGLAPMLLLARSVKKVGPAALATAPTL